MEVVRLFPHFFYCGNRHVKGDFDYITGKLARLSDENKRIISEQYAEVYRYHFNKKEYREARAEANKLLHNFVEEYGIKKSDVSQARTESNNDHQFKERIEKLRRSQKTGKLSILDMADRKGER
jgi:hypothetical protein